jgi:gamma-glutamyltranspeptidase/glutathione hydrolase
MLEGAFLTLVNPVRGKVGAVSTGHRLATEAALGVLADGGSAIDAMICAQAVICVVMPQAAGLGGDMLMLVQDSNSEILAINGTGKSAAEYSPPSLGSGASVTVPGIAAGWAAAMSLSNALPLERILAPALDLATNGYEVDSSLIEARDSQRPRLETNGAKGWSLLDAKVGQTWKQPELAELIKSLSGSGATSFYRDEIAANIVKATASRSGMLAVSDFANQKVSPQEPVSSSWNGETLFVQPPASQGILLAIVASWLDENAERFAGSTVGLDEELDSLLEHLQIEVTEAAFQYRDNVASVGKDLLTCELEINFDSPSHRGGPRSYLHTAGVAVTDSSGMSVSSLISVFDDFGSAIYVPELGITLNNRADGFTGGDNAYAPSSYPVHTLAPAILAKDSGEALALATPGADGQVQTLIQILVNMRFRGMSLSEAITSPRWRSEDGKLLIEKTHPRANQLLARGYILDLLPLGSDIFGAVVFSGIDSHGPYAAADFRRKVSAGAI